jgi:hypothetical protein
MVNVKRRQRPKPRKQADEDASQRTETDPALNNPDATPGTGMLPPLGEDEGNQAPSG